MPKKDQSPEVASPKFLLYKRLAVGFLCLTFLFILVIGVVTFWTATITIVPARIPAETTFRAIVVQGADRVAGALVPGAIDTALITGSAEASIPTTERVEGKARGKVTIKNTSSRAQPLVVKTRLLTKDGVLFRLTKSVDVPAKGSTEASVEADDAGAKGDIVPTRFTIPGLNPQLQELIYAESSKSMEGGLRMIGVVQQEHLDQAVAAAKENAVKTFTDAHPAQTRVSFFDRVEVLRVKTEEKIGDKTSVVHGEAQVRITRVRVPLEHLEEVGAVKLSEAIGNRITLLPLPLTIDATLDAVDTKTGRASLTVHTIGYSAVDKASPALSLDQFVGKSRGLIEKSLRDLPGVASVRVQIRPFFMPRTPYLQDHISIVVSK